MRFLVTAGNSRENIDDVRVWTNVFSGGTGLAIARALAPLGDVDLLTSNEQHLRELIAEKNPRLKGSGFSDHAGLKGALAALVTREPYDAIFMTAAVSDYRPARTFAVLKREPTGDGEETWRVRDVQAAKIKSFHRHIAVLGEKTEKLVDLFRAAWDYRGLLVKFKLEVGIEADELLRIGEASRRSSGADYLFANTLAMTGGVGAGAYLMSAKGHEWVPRVEIAGRAAGLVAGGIPPRGGE